MPNVALFVTCLVDFFRPNVGFAAVKLLEDAGCEVSVPEAQTCCGQPTFNNGDDEDTRAIARQLIETFKGYDYVVVPSGSCGGMIKAHYPELFAGDPQWEEAARELSSRTYELLSFLHDVLGVDSVDAAYSGKATYHDSCSGLRELKVKQQPRTLLQGVCEVEEMHDAEVCCGFGGTFCVKYPEISERMVSDKSANIEASGADTVLGGDMGCLLNIAGRLRREGKPIKAYHVAEVLAGMTDVPAIGEGEK